MIEREGGRHWWGGWISPTPCRCRCMSIHPGSPAARLFLAGARSSAKPLWKRPSGMRAMGPRRSPARLHNWLGRWHVFAPDYTFFCPEVPKPPASCSLEHGSSWFVTSGFVPLPFLWYFHPFPPSFSEISFSPEAPSSSFSAFPLNSCPTSQRHIYSCHLLLSSFIAEIFIKLLFRTLCSLTSPFIYPSAGPHTAKSSLPLCAKELWKFELEPRIFWENFLSACPGTRELSRILLLFKGIC